MKESASAVRMPLSSSGSALGTTTSHSIRSRFAPMLRADHTSACSLERAPLKAPIVTGSMQPRKISRMFYPMPKSALIPVTVLWLGDRDQRRFRHRVEHLDQRAEQHVDRSPPRHEDAERGADHDGEK